MARDGRAGGLIGRAWVARRGAAGFDAAELENYGKYKAKVPLSMIADLESNVRRAPGRPPLGLPSWGGIWVFVGRKLGRSPPNRET